MHKRVCKGALSPIRMLQVLFGVSVGFAAVGCGIRLSAATTGTTDLAMGDAGASGYALDAQGEAAAPPSVTLTPTGDAGARVAEAAAWAGSPLCNVTPTAACSPDDAGCSAECVKQALGDAGSLHGACNEGRGFACHVMAVRGDAGAMSVAPTCSISVAVPLSGTSDSLCESADDCAAGYECVINDGAPDAGGAGVCRRYCCNDSCSDPESFCDIETAVGGSVAVPVCRHAIPCQLLKDSCPTGLTCQIVDQNTGLIACDKAGSATAGQSCETEKCAKGFSCIGEFPNRQCAQLCDMDQSDCTSGTCTQNAALSINDSQVGVCAQ